MQESYTFSRALHLMRYGGKKMKPISWQSSCYIEVCSEKLIRSCNEYDADGYLSPDEIMGNWVEVKDD
jgi:hypothetical protein